MRGHCHRSRPWSMSKRWSFTAMLTSGLSLFHIARWKAARGFSTMLMSKSPVGQPAALKATPDRTTLKADGQDLSYIQLELLDKDGTLVQHLNRKVKGSIEGEGKLIGLINSDLRRTTPFTSKEDNTYFGRAMAIVQTTRKAGTIRLKLEVEGMAEPVVVILKSE